MIGRFYSNDPVGVRDIHSFNRYAYANNNPYKYIDPFGMASERRGNRDNFCGVSGCDYSYKEKGNTEHAMDLLNDFFDSSQEVADTAKDKVDSAAQTIKDHPVESTLTIASLGTGFGGLVLNSARLTFTSVMLSGVNVMVNPSLEKAGWLVVDMATMKMGIFFKGTMMESIDHVVGSYSWLIQAGDAAKPTCKIPERCN